MSTKVSINKQTYKLPSRQSNAKPLKESFINCYKMRSKY